MGRVRFKEEKMGSRFVTTLVSLSLCTAVVIGDTSSKVDLSDSVIVSGSNMRAIKAAEFLQTEIQNRTGIILATSTSMPADTVAAIVLGKIGYFPASYALPPGLSVPTEDEGYALWASRTARTAPTVYLVGRDDKGALFAAGMLIRKLDLARNYIRLDYTVKIESSPAYPMRGQQMLTSTQSEDRFVNWRSVEQLEQYIRDLALFGTNTIEPSGPDDVDEFLEELGIDLQVWAGGNKVLELNRLSDQKIRDEFSYLTGVDHFFTPGGDTSSSRLPMDVLPALERVGPLVMEGHSGSKWWYSNQCQDYHALDYDDYTFGYIQGNEPTWLYGMVYGPWTKRGIPEIRADLPSQYKIRHYPDICHVRWCQYVVPKWDRAWAQVWDRNKSIYAMPKMMRDIHNATRSDTVGFVAYNHTGSYNDLNKFIFSAMGWDPTADINDILCDYARVFFAYDYRNYPDGDFDHNMIVDMKDYALLARDWGTSQSDVNSIVLWYKFDESSRNTALDSSCNMNDGTLYNMTDADWITGKMNNAVVFDGVRDSPADADSDGDVDVNDLAIFASTWLDSVTEAQMIEEGSKMVAQGLLLLGDNWIGPIADNTSAAAALDIWKEIAENMGGPEGVGNNWRLQMFLTKAFIDAQVKRKYDAEMQYEQEAYEALQEADVVGVTTAVNNALAALAKIDTEFQSKADFKNEMLSWGLGAGYGDLDETLNSLYSSLTNRVWLEDRLASVSTLSDIDAVLNYEDAEPGGFYDNLGAQGKQPHLVRQMTWQEDPGFVHSPIEWNDHSPGSHLRQSQLCHATCRYDTPLLMRWEGLDPTATYHIEVVYLGPFGPKSMCETDDGYLIHGPRGNSGTTPVSYGIPSASTSDGVLQLQWQLTNVVRGVSVTEIWLIKD